MENYNPQSLLTHLQGLSQVSYASDVINTCCALVRFQVCTESWTSSLLYFLPWIPSASHILLVINHLSSNGCSTYITLQVLKRTSLLETNCSHELVKCYQYEEVVSSSCPSLLKVKTHHAWLIYILMNACCEGTRAYYFVLCAWDLSINIIRFRTVLETQPLVSNLRLSHP